MPDSNASLGPEGPVQGSWSQDDLQAVIQEIADIIRDLKQCTESRQEQAEQDRQNLRLLFARWEQEDAQGKETGHDAQIEESKRRMKEQDARIEENLRDIRRRLDELERRRGEGDSGEEQTSEG